MAGQSHTAGPWRTEDRRDWTGSIWIMVPDPEPGCGDVSIAEVRAGCDEAEQTGDVAANARLIAAAPELLEQIVLIDDRCRTHAAALRDGAALAEAAEERGVYLAAAEMLDGIRVEARAAISKATGEGGR